MFGSYSDALIILGDVFAKAKTEEERNTVRDCMKVLALAEAQAEKEYADWWETCRRDSHAIEFDDNDVVY